MSAKGVSTAGCFVLLLNVLSSAGCAQRSHPDKNPTATSIAPTQYLSRGDTLEILTQVARKFWGRPQPDDTAQLFPADEMTRDALRPILVARGAPIHPVWIKGESTNCPSKTREPSRLTGWVVELRVIEMKGETVARVTFSCGQGWRNAFATGSIFRVRRVNNCWVVGESIGDFIT